MRRSLLVLALLAAAAPTLAANSFDLDRTGILWRGQSTAAGLVLTGERAGSIEVSTVVPFPVGINGTNDSEIQVAVDEITGKVAVVWQRNWSPVTSEIIAAVWDRGSWEQVLHLTADQVGQPRFPSIRLSHVSSTVDTAEGSETFTDSFLHVVWWQGDGPDAHACYALLCLTADPLDDDRLLIRNLDRLVGVGLACDVPAPESVLEHPLFASGPAASPDTALVLFGSQRICFLNLAEVTFSLEPPAEGSGITVVAQRRRHVPVFGVRRMLPVPRELAMEGARVIVGMDLSPVAYRVEGQRVDYVLAEPDGWSELRTLSTGASLTLDQAIPLVENLAR